MTARDSMNADDITSEYITPIAATYMYESIDGLHVNREYTSLDTYTHLTKSRGSLKTGK